MKETDVKEWRTVIAALAAGWRVELGEPQYLAYWAATEDLELDQVRRGVFKAIREGGEFMPSPPQLRRLSGARPPLAAPYHQYWEPPDDWQLSARDGWKGLIEGLKPEEE